MHRLLGGDQPVDRITVDTGHHDHSTIVTDPGRHARVFAETGGKAPRIVGSDDDYLSVYDPCFHGPLRYRDRAAQGCDPCSHRPAMFNIRMSDRIVSQIEIVVQPLGNGAGMEPLAILAERLLDLV